MKPKLLWWVAVAFAVSACVEPPSEVDVVRQDAGGDPGDVAGSPDGANAVPNARNNDGGTRPTDMTASDASVDDLGATDTGAPDMAAEDMTVADTDMPDLGPDAGMDMCVPDPVEQTCVRQSAECGLVVDNCTQVADCGSCMGTATCMGTDCVCPAGEGYRGGGCVPLVNRYIDLLGYTNRVISSGQSAHTVTFNTAYPAAYAVPFFSQRLTGTQDIPANIQVDISIPGDGQVGFKRAGTTGAVALGGAVVVFDPADVKVQSGVFGLDTVMTETQVPIEAVDRNSTFLVFYFSNTETVEDRKAYSDVAGFFDNDSNLRFRRVDAAGAIEGHWYVVEALSGQFDVQHVVPSSDMTDDSVTIATQPYSPGHTMLIYSHATNSYTDDAAISHIGCSPASGSSVECRRSTADDSIVDLNVQLVSFNGSSQTVRHGAMTLADGVTEGTRMFSPSPSFTTIWGGYAGKPGAAYTNIRSSSVTPGAFVELAIDYQGSAAVARRGGPVTYVGSSEPGPVAARAAWQVIDW